MIRRSILIPFAAALLAVSLVASAKFRSAGDADIHALAIGPAGMKINCRSGQLDAEEKDGKLVVSAPLTNIKTGIGLRDKHLRKYLETDKYPNATLTVEKSKLKLPDDDKTSRGSATGQLSLHGVTKPLTFSYRAKRSGNDYSVLALARIDIRDYKVEVPCYLGVCVEPEVKIKVKFKLRDQ